MPGCFESSPSKTITYSTKGIKPCVSAPSCSVHKHRPRPAPCPNPDTCYRKSIRKKQKCASAMEVVNRDGSACCCSKLQDSSRYGRGKSQCTIVKHRTRLRKAYARRSMVSRWDPQVLCCKCCPGCRNIGCCKCCKCCEKCCKVCFKRCTIL